MINVSVPGRICLFGEHQDYLKLPVITAAINLRIQISGTANDSGCLKLRLPDIDEEKTIRLPQRDAELEYVEERDYFRSAYNVLQRTGIQMLRGCEATVTGNIPINSGTSSSSALTVAWCRFLLEAGGPLDESLRTAENIARLAHMAEVSEFNEPGGMMDHYATALGGVLFQNFENGVQLEQLKNGLGAFVLGDSLLAKDTKAILSRVKSGVLRAVEIISELDPSFDLRRVQIEDIKPYRDILSEDQYEVLKGALINREITSEAQKLFTAERWREEEFGYLLNKHQRILDKLLGISPPKINNMLQAALNAGAYGGKINGSGGGGYMFVYAPENTADVARAIEDRGGKAYIVQIDEGIKVY